MYSYSCSVPNMYSCHILTHPIVQLTEAHALAKNLQLVKSDLEIKVLKWSSICVNIWSNFVILSYKPTFYLSTSGLLDAIVNVFNCFE